MKSLLAFLLTVVFLPLLAQETGLPKRPLDHRVYDGWKEISSPLISADGRWAAYEINPFKGDGFLFIHDLVQGTKDSIARGKSPVFDSGSRFLAFKIAQPQDSIRRAKLAKKKDEELPKDSLGIYLLGSGKVLRHARVKSFKLGQDGGDWIGIHFEKALPLPEKQSGDSLNPAPPKKMTEKKKGEKEKDEPEPCDFLLLNPITGETDSIQRVTEYALSRDGESFVLAGMTKDSLPLSELMLIRTRPFARKTLSCDKGKFRKPVLSADGSQLAYFHRPDSSGKNNPALLYYHQNQKVPAKLVDSSVAKMPKDWACSLNFDPWFSRDGQTLFLGIAPIPTEEKKDSLLDEDRVRLDLWAWTDARLQSQQLKDLEKEKKQTWMAVIRTKSQEFVPLADSLVPEIRTGFRGNGRYALGTSDLPYLLSSSWEGSGRSDYYLLDIETGAKSLVGSGRFSHVNLSPDQTWLTWFDQEKRQWFGQALPKGIPRCLSCEIPYPLTDEEHDTPDEAPAHGSPGWSTGDKYLLVYDRYDLWALDPRGKEKPRCLTNQNGRKNRTVLRLWKTDPESPDFNLNEDLYFRQFSEITKATTISLLKPNGFRTLLSGNFSYSIPQKAKNSNRVLFTRQSFSDFPNLWVSTLDFQSPRQISDANPQQKDYRWGKAELVRWRSLEGDSLEGILYQPDNITPGKSYPMIVYFYERNSDQLFSHYAPRTSRSVISFSWYTSNDYFVFVPDIPYHTGFPGESAYRSVMSGTLAMLERHPEIDPSRLGLQGQSWGGYQVAYLVTRTGLFAAAMAGAPVANMTSAYGAIRWESGLNRIFQYERGQSRIGQSLWKNPEAYIRNSPLFMADQIQTPLLIMANDNDGAVPWYQGIEMFTSLRRLGKPAWMLNYNGDEHNLGRKPNRLDLTIRMSQFFDHYLKGSPAPDWLIKGVPAMKKNEQTGLQLIEK